MKAIIICALFFSAIFCSYKYSNSFTDSQQSVIDPSTILLVDSFASTTINCVKNGSTWTVSDTSETIGYLVHIAKDVFGKDSVTNFHDIQVDFDSLYQNGTLIGIGTRNGKNVPIGIEYEFTSSSSSGTTISMGNPTTHTCTGVQCSCCKFLRERRKIKGCYCEAGAYDCNPSGNGHCDHTVSTTEK